MFYKKLNVPNFEDMRQELENTTAENVNNKTRFWDVPYDWFKDNAPLFYKFIEDNRKVPIRLCRFYLTPAYDSLRPHIDGLTTHKSPIGLNIPIIGYNNTSMDWYDCPDDNLIDGHYGFNGIYASRVIRLDKLSKVESVEIDSPTFVRTDIVHGVVNRNPTPRLVLSIRFPYNSNFGRQFDDVMELSGLAS